MTDPWSSKNNTPKSINSEKSDSIPKNNFEDNFAPPSEPLPDSAAYLQGLERRLQRIKEGAKLVDALAEKRQDTLRSFLLEDVAYNNNANLELDIPINNIDSAVQGICRQLQPVQPVTVGETVHIVHYDQLEQQRQEEEIVPEESETEPASR